MHFSAANLLLPLYVLLILADLRGNSRKVVKGGIAGTGDGGGDGGDGDDGGLGGEGGDGGGGGERGTGWSNTVSS